MMRRRRIKIDLSFKTITENWNVTKKDIRTYNPVTLAFIGDTIYDLFVRTLIVGEGNASVNVMNRRAASIVKAEAQAKVHDLILPMLSEQEADILRRGRNAHKKTSAKNASITDYHKATGVEALIGYLYMSGDTERIYEIMRLAISDGLKTDIVEASLE